MIGTLVSSSALLACLVAVPVTFVVLFAGVIGPNVASGAMGALLAFVLPAVSPGTASVIPDRLAGWWLASVVSTAAVLLLSPKSPGDKLRGSAVTLATTLAAEVDAMADGTATPEQHAACVAAKHGLITTFAATPYRPTGLATADQALEPSVSTERPAKLTSSQRVR